MVWVQQRLALIDKDKRYERRWELASRLGARLAAQSENGFEYWQNLYDSTFTDEEYEAQEAAELAAKMKILEEQRADRGALMQG